MILSDLQNVVTNTLILSIRDNAIFLCRRKPSRPPMGISSGRFEKEYFMHQDQYLLQPG